MPRPELVVFVLDNPGNSLTRDMSTLNSTRSLASSAHPGLYNPPIARAARRASYDYARNVAAHEGHVYVSDYY